jgi:hypothetical protein
MIFNMHATARVHSVVYIYVQIQAVLHLHTFNCFTFKNIDTTMINIKKTFLYEQTS